MAKIVKKRCPHCLKVMRNDGTEENPVYVCDNKECVKYEPKKK